MAGKLVTWKLEGLHELVSALNELPKATSLNVQRRALAKAADPIQSDAERLAPRRPKGQPVLSRSFSTGTKLSRRQKAKHKKESRVELFVGPEPLVQAITQEFGTSFHPPQPFMRPAWDANKRRAFDTIRDNLAAEIDKAAQRLARKAARLAAKQSRA